MTLDNSKQIARYLRELIYPRTCPICGKIVIPKSQKICPSCIKQLEYVTEPCCKKCGKPVSCAEQEYCFDCSRKEFWYHSGMALFVYNHAMQASIGAFKFHGKKEYADFYIDEMVKRMEEKIIDMKADILIPVPIHKDKRRQRGYNQAELLARKLSDSLCIPVDTRLLIRNRYTLPQKQLNDKERLKNLEQAFEINMQVPNAFFTYQHVILIDDIYTTGSTIEACARVLLTHGIPKISFISLCIGKGY